MKSELYRVASNDFIKGAVTAVLAAVITVIAGLVTQVGFDVFSADWGAIGKSVVNVSAVTFFAYLIKNFASDEDGKLMGKI